MENEKVTAAMPATLEVNPEQKIVILGCVNPKVIEQIKKVVEGEGCELVMLEDKVIADYLHVKDPQRNPSAEHATIEQFLTNESNRLTAQEQAHKLYAILSKGKNIEDAEQAVFTEKEVCAATTLSHSKANHLFNLLRAFGLFEWVDIKARSFKIHFTPYFKIRAIEKDVMNLIHAVDNEVLRYKCALMAAKIEDEKTAAKIEDLKIQIRQTLNF